MSIAVVNPETKALRLQMELQHAEIRIEELEDQLEGLESKEEQRKQLPPTEQEKLHEQIACAFVHLNNVRLESMGARRYDFDKISDWVLGVMQSPAFQHIRDRIQELEQEGYGHEYEAGQGESRE